MLLVIILAAVIALFIVGWINEKIETRKELEEADWNREMCNYYREED